MKRKALHEGKEVTVYLSGKNKHGEPYSGAGYQTGHIMKVGKKVQGRVVFLMGGWHFEEKEQ